MTYPRGLLLAMLVLSPLAPAVPTDLAQAGPAPAEVMLEVDAALQAAPPGATADPFAATVRWGVLTTRLQSARLGYDWTPPPGHGPASPADALRTVAHRAGASVPEEHQAALAALDAAPRVPREALARFLDAYLAFDDAARAAFAGADLPALVASLQPSGGPATPATRAVLGSHGVDLAAVFPARAALLERSLALRDALAASPGALPRLHLAVPPAFALDLAGEDSTFRGSFALVLDVGGDDLHLHNAGGSSVLGCLFVIHGSTAAGAAALLDLGGNDRYGDARFCGVNGGAQAGAGFLLDAAGNDTYGASGFALNGGGALGGAGFLADADGDDLYAAVRGAMVNGGASLAGVGHLLDHRGHDRYLADANLGANGGGANLGHGLLVDLAGDDAYEAGAFGVNGSGALGLGLLFDGGGRDVYRDEDGGSGTDVTVAPKGLLGAQVDRPG